MCNILPVWDVVAWENKVAKPLDYSFPRGRPSPTIVAMVKWCDGVVARELPLKQLLGVLILLVTHRF